MHDFFLNFMRMIIMIAYFMKYVRLKRISLFATAVFMLFEVCCLILHELE